MEKINIKQKRDIGDLIQDGFILLYSHARPLWYNVFLYIVPIFFLTGVLTGLWSYDLEQEMAKMSKELQINEMMEFFKNSREHLFNANYWGMVVATLISSSMLSATVYNFVHQYTENETVHTDELRSAGLQDSGWMIGFSVVSALMISAGLFLFLLPAIYILIWVCMLGIVGVVERGSLSESLNRCRQILAGNWLYTFFLLFVLWVIQFVLNILFGGIAHVLILPLKGVWGAKLFTIIDAMISSGISAIVSCYLLVMLALHYYSLIAKDDKPSVTSEDLGRKF